MNTGSIDLSNMEFITEKNADNYLTKPIFSANITTELSDDLILPDYIADVKKIIAVYADIERSENELADGKLHCFGEVGYTALLLTEEDTYKSVSLTSPYDKAADVQESLNPAAVVTESLSAVQGRLVNPRKLNLKSKVECDAKVYGRFDTEPKISGNTAEQPIERDIISVETMSVATVDGERVAFSEDIEIDATLPAVADILCVRLLAYTTEIRPSQDKVQLAAEAEVSFIYTDDNGGLCSIVKRLPISITIPTDMTAQNASIIPMLSVREVKCSAANNSYGERRVIELDFAVEPSLAIFENKSIDVTRDAYSTLAQCTVVTSDAQLYTAAKIQNSSFSYDARISRSELTIPENARPLYTCADMNIKESTYDDSRERMILSGDVEISMLVAGDGTAAVISYSSPFKYEADCGIIKGEASCSAEITAVNARGRIDGGGVYCDLEAMVTMTVTDKKSESIVSEIKISEPKASQHRPNVLLYYPSEGERLWDIAKRYNTTREAVSAANNINGETIANERVIMIPNAEKRTETPVYTKVI